MITCELPRVGRQVMQTRDVSRFRVGLIGYGAIGAGLNASTASVGGYAGWSRVVGRDTRRPKQQTAESKTTQQALVHAEQRGSSDEAATLWK
jgi:hypothetical protein